MKTISKLLVGTVAAGAVAMTSATPAMARDHDGISVGDVIAGALIVGGIAAVASAASHDNDRYYTSGGPYNYNGGYNSRYGYNGGNPRQAVQQCVNAATANANRYGYGRGARVTDIRDVDSTRYGYRVKGTIVVNERNGGWGRDYGYRNNGRNYDRGKFSCDVQYGRVVDLDYSGLRGR